MARAWLRCMADSTVTLACTRYITAQKTHSMQQQLLLEADTFLVPAGKETFSGAKEYN